MHFILPPPERMIQCYIPNSKILIYPFSTGYVSLSITLFSNQFHGYSISFHSLLTSQIKIRVGEYDFSSIQEPYPFAERGVARKVVHPKYNFFTYEYDLAMVRLDSPLEYAPHIVPICLPGSDDLLIGENATVTGWGRLSEGGTLPSVLQEVRILYYFLFECINAIEK